MPELPEVETVRGQLAPQTAGRRIVQVSVLDPRWCAPSAPEEAEDAIAGHLIESVDRRGKYLTLALQDEVYLVMHLRMTGNLLLVDAQEDAPDRPHLRVRMVLDDDRRVLFVDQRRFGTGVVLLGQAALLEYF
ncbi:MAG: DNA-formamidopyrimidine glycosylase family protein, partial [Thermoleophilaceae bacterium]